MYLFAEKQPLFTDNRPQQTDRSVGTAAPAVQAEATGQQGSTDQSAVQQSPNPSAHQPVTGELPDDKRYELQQVADTNVFSTALLSLFLPPVGYYMVGREKLALFAFITGFFAGLGILLAPFHTRSIILNARSTLERHGYAW